MTKTTKKSANRTKTVAYDVAEQLRTPEEMAAYLDAWLAEASDDAAGIARALGDIARARGPHKRLVQEPRDDLEIVILSEAKNREGEAPS